MNQFSSNLKLFTILILSLFANLNSISQVTIFEEDFESNILSWKFENEGTNNENWVKNTVLHHGGLSCAHNPYTESNTNILFTTDPIDFTYITSPILSFWHIAKTEQGLDKCYIEFSVDGINYYPLPPSVYTGTSTYFPEGSGGFFSENSNTAIWGTNNIPAQNTWWKQETFNLSTFDDETSVRFRFKITSDATDNRVGWYIDDVAIKGTSTNDKTSKIDSGPSIEPATISSLMITAPGVMVFDFKFTDMGNSDLLPTIIDKISITKGSANDFVDWSVAIAGATLSGPDISDFSGVISSNQIDFNGDNFIEVEDGVANAETYQLKIWLNAGNIGFEGDNFEFKISNLDIINDPIGSVFASDAEESGNIVNALSVEATKLTFSLQPSDTPIDNYMEPSVRVSFTDIYGNPDRDYDNNIITLTSTGSMIDAPVSSDPTVDGFAIYSFLQHDVLGTNLELTATYNTWTVTSEYFDIVPNPCYITTSPPSFEGELRMCAGVNMVELTGNYTGAGTPTYYWELGDGHTLNGQVVTKTFEAAAGYNLNLVVSADGHTCQTDLKILVSPGPVIGNIADDITFCLGQSYDLSAGADGSTIEVDAFEGAGLTTLSLSDTTYLPDTQTEFTVYTTTLTYTQFASDAILDDVNKLTVYANMEHSFFGDLEIEIICPDNSRIHLQNGYYAEPSPNQSNYMGEPVDEYNDGIPGVGYEYRWTENNPEYGIMETFNCPYYSYIDVTGVSRSNEYFPAGTYAPYESFSTMEGCPLNGDWTIVVTDSWDVDDGFIFEWGLELDASLMPSNWDYETTITSYTWNGPGTITGVGANVNVTPPVPGTNIYTLTVKDDFGCITQQNLNIYVTEGFPFEINDITTCADSVVLDAGSGYVSYIWKNVFGVTVATSQTYTVYSSGNYSISVSDGECSSMDNVKVVLGSFTYNAPSDEVLICEGTNTLIDAGLGYASYEWTLDSNIVAITRKYAPIESGVYYIKVKNSHGCYSTDSIIVSIVPSPVLEVISSDFDNFICTGDGLTLTASGADSYVWNNGISNGVEFFPDITSNYIVTGSNILGGCNSTLTIPVSVISIPEITLNDTISCGTTALLNAGNGFSNYTWLNNLNDTIGTEQFLVVNTNGDFTIVVSNGYCSNSDIVEVTLGGQSFTGPTDPDTFCIGDSTSIDAGNGFMSYQWIYESNVVGTEQNFIVYQDGTYIITIQIDDDCYLSDLVNVSTFELPVIEIISSDTDSIICIGNGITLSCAGSDTYAWDNGILNGIEFFPAETETYTVTATDINSCQNTEQIIIQVVEPIQFDIIDSVKCDNSDIIIDAGDEFITYEWIFDGTTIGSNQTIDITHEGTFTFSYEDIHGCLNSDDFIISDNPSPVITIDSQVICDEDSYMFEAGGVFVSYSWTDILFQEIGNLPFIGLEDEGVYNLTVENEFGCFDTTEFTLTVNESPIAFAGDDIGICAGEYVTLTATGGTNYDWNNGVIQDEQFMPTETTTYTVTVFNDFNCSDTDSIAVIVYELPQIDIQDTSYCANDDITIDAGFGFENYLWVFEGDTIGITQTIDISQLGIYTLILEDLNGCINSDNFEISENPIPSISIEDQEVCEGDSYLFIADAGYVSYFWTNQIGFPIGYQQFINLENDGNFNLRVENEFGCFGYSDFSLTLNENPDAFAGNDFNICTGDAVILSATGGVNYEWDNGVIQNQEFIPLSTTTYSVIVFNDNDCSSTDEITIIVNELPSINIEDNTLCTDNSIIINAGGGFENYIWEYNGNTIGISQSINISIGGDYTISVEDLNGCINTDNFNISEKPNPSILINNQEVCEGESYLFDAGQGFLSYSWTDTLNYEIGDLQTIDLSSQGNYNITVENEFGCFGSANFSLNVNELPNAFAGNDNDICSGDTITLTATGGITYEWNNGIVQGVEFEPLSTSIYTVTVYNENNCFDSDNVLITVHDNPVLDINPECNICFGDTMTLDAGEGFSRYSWSSGESTQVINKTKSDIYTITVYNEYDCSSTQDINLVVNPLPIINKIYTSNIDEITIEAESDAALFYSIDDGLSYSVNNIFTRLAPGPYTITVLDDNDCLTKQIHLLDITNVFIPQFFTPNFDGTNDTWEIGGIKAFQDATIEIYDRFGKLLTSYGCNDNGWDGTYRGKTMTSDSYWYVIDLKYNNMIFTGYVTIKR